MRTICLATPHEDPARFARAQAHFAEVGLTHVSYATGLHKSTSGLDSTHLYMVDRGPGSPDEGIPYHMGPHPTNIWIGHWMIWNALVLSGDPEWFVVECDAKFQPWWRDKFWRVISDTPSNYDLIYMGSCCTTGRPKTEVAPHIYRLSGTAPQCNHAYVVTAEAARIMLARLRQVWAPIDIQQASECWGDPLPRCVEPTAPLERPLNVYTVLPRIVDQWDTEISA